MTQIPKQDLYKYIGKEIIQKESGMENIIELEGIKGGWLRGFNKTNNSFIEILMNDSKGENAVKYFLK